MIQEQKKRRFDHNVVSSVAMALDSRTLASLKVIKYTPMVLFLALIVSISLQVLRILLPHLVFCFFDLTSIRSLRALPLCGPLSLRRWRLHRPLLLNSYVERSLKISSMPYFTS
jgi:hypothetical protein